MLWLLAKAKRYRAQLQDHRAGQGRVEGQFGAHRQEADNWHTFCSYFAERLFFKSGTSFEYCHMLFYSCEDSPMILFFNLLIWRITLIGFLNVKPILHSCISCTWLWSNTLSIYSWHWNTAGVRDTDPLNSWKSECNFSWTLCIPGSSVILNFCIPSSASVDSINLDLTVL